jgi:hypothetical protein
MVSLGCQQRRAAWYRRQSTDATAATGEETLDNIRFLCPTACDSDTTPAWIRQCGTGNYTLFFILYFLWLGLRYEAWKLRQPVRHGRR